jgi:hypothetical protein
MSNNGSEGSVLWALGKNEMVRKILTLIEKTVAYRRKRWGYLIFFYAYVLYRVFHYDYLGLMYIIGLYVIYLIVQYFTPSGLPDPDEDTP